MPRIHTLQTGFITGQLDEAAQGRSETPLYRNGAAALLNCEPFVSGGVRSRRGSRWLADLPDGPVALAEFAFSLAQSYVAAFTPGRVDLFFAADGAPAGSVTGCPWGAAQIPQLRFAQLGDVMWIACSDVWPQELVRLGAAAWTVRPMAFDGPSATPTLRYTASGVTIQSGGDQSTGFTMGGLPTVNGQTAVIVAGTRGQAQPSAGGPWVPFRVNKVSGFHCDVTWYGAGAASVSGAAIKVQFYATGVITFVDPPDPISYNTTLANSTGDGPAPTRVFFNADTLSAAHLGTVLRMRDETAGRYCTAVIQEVLDMRTARVAWDGAFLPPGQETLLWEEQAISGVRGFFRSVCIYQQRLCFGGTTTAGAALFLSRAAAFRNFGLGEARDTDAIAIQAAGGVRTIRHLVDAAQLTVFTENGISYVPIDKTKPLTPSTIRLEKVAPYGASDVRPGAFDGGLLFALAGNSAVRDVNYNSVQDNVQADPVSLPASGFLGTLTDAAFLSASNTRPEELALFVNAAGRIVVFHSIRSQKVGAWFEWSTPGAGWRAVGVAGQTVFAVCRRRPGALALEMFDPALPFDGCVRFQGAAAAPLPAFTVPAGTVLHAVDDAGDYLGSGVSAAGGVLATRQTGSFPDNGTGAGVVGQAFDWWIDPLPPAIDLPDGSLLQRAQRLVRTSLRLLGAQSAAIGADALVLRADGFDPGVQPPAFTGWRSFRHLGWARPGAEGRALVPRISRDVPLPVAVLSMKREIKA